MANIRSKEGAVRVINGNSTILLCFWGLLAVLVVCNLSLQIWHTTTTPAAPLPGMIIFFALALMLRISHSRIVAVLLILCTILGVGGFAAVVISDLEEKPWLITADAITIIVMGILLWTSLRATFATFTLHKYHRRDQTFPQ
jgi:hypothetical protein